MKTRKYTLQIEIQVTDNWIQDGFNPESKVWKNEIEMAIRNLMPHAYDKEFVVDVKKVAAPNFTIGELEELGLIEKV